jgi:hypothetical protein
VLVQLPPDYACSNDPNVGCWFKVRETFDPTTSPTDITTWLARLDGDPVRLVPNQTSP